MMDAVLNVEDVHHSEITRERVNLAAATQLVFEDGLFHIIDHFIRETGSDKLVMCGGTAMIPVGRWKRADPALISSRDARSGVARQSASNRGEDRQPLRAVSTGCH